MTDSPSQIENLVRLRQQLADDPRDLQPTIDRAVEQLRALSSKLADAEHSEGLLREQLSRAQQQIERLQDVLGEQADELAKHRELAERVVALADLAEWARQSAGTTAPAQVQASDLRRAVALESTGRTAS